LIKSIYIMKCYLRLFLKLFLFIIIYNSIFNLVTGTEFKQNAVSPADSWIPNEMMLDRTEIPKNILLGVTIEGKLNAHFDHEN
jgi:hypothetical protein